MSHLEQPKPEEDEGEHGRRSVVPETPTQEKEGAPELHTELDGCRTHREVWMMVEHQQHAGLPSGLQLYWGRIICITSYSCIGGGSYV